MGKNKSKQPPRFVTRAEAQRLLQKFPSRSAHFALRSQKVSSDLDWGRSEIKPDKGHKDGSCNRTACQRPLAGQRQYYMRDYMVTDGRLYYCEECAMDFTRWDHIDRPGEPVRCTLDETTVTETK